MPVRRVADIKNLTKKFIMIMIMNYKTKLIVFFAIFALALCPSIVEAQLGTIPIHRLVNGAQHDYDDDAHWAWILDENNNEGYTFATDQLPSSGYEDMFSWWANGYSSHYGQLMMLMQEVSGLSLFQAYEQTTPFYRSYYDYDKELAVVSIGGRGDNSGGRLGIGIDVPERPLHMRGSDALLRIDRNSKDPGMMFVRYNSDYSQVYKTFFLRNRGTGVNNGSFDIIDMGTTVGGSTAQVSRLHIANDGKIGIGTTSPTEKLSVDGNIHITGTLLVDGPLGDHLEDNHRVIRSSVDEKSVELPGEVKIKATINGVDHFGIIKVTSVTDQFGTNPAVWLGSQTAQDLALATNNIQRLKILKTGEVIISADVSTVSINQTQLDKYSLFVEQGLLSEDYALSPRTNWSDYVFKEDYPLKPLKEVASFIEENHHLPNIPSQEQIQEEGYNLHEMNIGFLEKIEELTLYTIAQEKEITALKKEMQQQLTNYAQLAEAVASLKAKLK